jgi:3-oxoacyl-[acyl-carrier-protein] synthase-3
MIEVSIAATASILPETVITNHEIGERLIAGFVVKDAFDVDLVAQVRTRAELIERKTGLRARRFFKPEQQPVEVGLDLLSRLMKPSGAWGALDGIIVSSSSAHGFPGLSQQILARARAQHPEIGHPFVLDIGSNACTGFIYALTVGTSLVRAMQFRRIALLAIEFSSRCIAYDPNAFGTSTLFGDAAAGVLLQGAKGGVASVEAVRASSMVDGDAIQLIKGGGMEVARPDLKVPDSRRWYMAGPPVAIGATKILTEEIKRYQASGAAIDWLIPHQANLTRILVPACKTVGIDPARLRASFAETGNTSSASIPLLLDDLVRSGDAKTGDSALLIGFGASFSLGSALLKLNDVPVRG